MGVKQSYEFSEELETLLNKYGITDGVIFGLLEDNKQVILTVNPVDENSNVIEIVRNAVAKEIKDLSNNNLYQ